jgi:RimJ/RimL family protein N-acetyltransferase
MGGRVWTIGWRTRVAWAVARAAPKAALAWIGAFSLIGTFALSAGSESWRAIFVALPIAVTACCIAAVWRWSTRLASIPRPLLDALDGIETDRLLLRRARRRDVPAYRRTIDAVYLETNGTTNEVLKATIWQMKTGLGLPAWALVLVTDRTTGTVLGDVTVHRCDDEESTCELGWSMGPEHRGKGYGTEALRAVFPALHIAGVGRIIVGTAPDNAAVRRVLDKLGAHQIESRPHLLPNGTTVDSLWFAHDTDSSTTLRSHPT